MVAGGFLSAFVLIPAIRLFGDGLAEPLYPATALIKNMDEEGDLEKLCPLYRRRCRGGGWHHQSFQALP